MKPSAPVRLFSAALRAAPAFFAASLFAADETITDASGDLSTVVINLTLHENVGGTLATSAQVSAAQAKGILYRDVTTYDLVYDLEPTSNIRNPFGWNPASGNFYFEKTVIKALPEGQELITVTGEDEIRKTRYTGATLLADLAATGRIPGTKNYRLVAVRFDLDEDADYENTTGGYTTIVTDGLYFFAEKGADDPAPVFLGAEYDIYAGDEIIDFGVYDTLYAGKYVETFQGSEGLGYDYALRSDKFSGTSLGDFSIYRPAADNSYYQLYVGGTFTWSENYDSTKDRYRRGAVSGTHLSGTGSAYVPVDLDEDGVDDEVDAAPALVTGSISLPSASFQASLEKYLKQIPPTDFE